METKPNRKTVRAAIRGSVPDAKLRKAKIILSDAKYGESAIAGFTEFSDDRASDVVKLGAPADDDATGIVIRGHETRHATKHRRSRKKKMTEREMLCTQIIDDVNIESTPVPRGTTGARAYNAYNRAHLVVAMRDLTNILRHKRNMERGLKPDNAVNRNRQLIHAVRVLAMLVSYGKIPYGYCETFRKGREKLLKVFGSATSRAISDVVNMAKHSRQRNRAVSLLLSLLETEETPEQLEEREEQLRHEPCDILEPVVEGTALDGKMKITDLRPKSVFCAKEKQITRRFAPDGVFINQTRYCNAIVSGDSNGLFARRIRHKAGGVVLIDASGSMSASATNLAALCALIPTATVGYYSGVNAGNGELCVYAYEGMRYSGALPEETLHGNNCVDLPAVQWMMRQPKPWILVSDLEFCSGVLGSETLAHALVERAQQRGDLLVYHSLDAAYEAFGGSGNLPDGNPHYIKTGLKNTLK